MPLKNLIITGSDGKGHFISDLSGPEDVAFNSLMDMVIVADTGCVSHFPQLPFNATSISIHRKPSC